MDTALPAARPLRPGADRGHGVTDRQLPGPYHRLFLTMCNPRLGRVCPPWDRKEARVRVMLRPTFATAPIALCAAVLLAGCGDDASPTSDAGARASDAGSRDVPAPAPPAPCTARAVPGPAPRAGCRGGAAPSAACSARAPPGPARSRPGSAMASRERLSPGASSTSPRTLDGSAWSWDGGPS